MRLAGLVLIFFGVGATGMGLADVAKKGMDLRLAGIGIAVICSGVLLVRIGSRKTHLAGFEVKLPTGGAPVMKEKENDHD